MKFDLYLVEMLLLTKFPDNRTIFVRVRAITSLVNRLWPVELKMIMVWKGRRLILSYFMVGVGVRNTVNYTLTVCLHFKFERNQFKN